MTKILIIMDDSSIASGIESLLSEESGLVVESAKFRSGIQIKELMGLTLPDVVILDESMLALRHFSLYDLLECSSNVKIVALSLQVNQMNVLNRYEVIITEYQDLISTIQNK